MLATHPHTTIIRPSFLKVTNNTCVEIQFSTETDSTLSIIGKQMTQHLGCVHSLWIDTRERIN